LNYDNTRPQPTISPVLVQQGRQSDVVGKLTVDRPTLGRGLEAQPGMLATILDAIDVALQTTDFVEPPEAEKEQDFEFDA